MVGRPPGDSADGKERLLDACWKLLLDLIPGQRLTIAAVCEEAGCTPPTLYHHFGSLESLERAASERALEQWSEELMASYGQVEDVEERLMQFAREYMDWGIENPRAFYVMFMRPGANYLPDGLSNLRRIPPLEHIITDLGAVCGLDEDDPVLLQMALSHWVAANGIISMAIASASFTREAQDATFEQLTSSMTDPYILPQRSSS